MPPVGASTGRPALSASVSVGADTRLDANDTDVPSVPARDARDQASATDSDQNDVEIARLLREFERERPLTEDRLDLIECVDHQRPGSGRPRFARRQGFGIAVANDRKIGAISANPVNLCGRRHRGHEDLRRDAAAARRKSDRCAMIAARRRDDAGVRYGTSQEMRKRAASLERAGMLQQLQLQCQITRRQAGIGATG